MHAELLHRTSCAIVAIYCIYLGLKALFPTFYLAGRALALTHIHFIQYIFTDRGPRLEFPCYWRYQPVLRDRKATVTSIYACVLLSSSSSLFCFFILSSSSSSRFAICRTALTKIYTRLNRYEFVIARDPSVSYYEIELVGIHNW